MTLRYAVSKILSRNVTNKEAKEFASSQYGVLCAFIRSEAFKNIIIDKMGEEGYVAIVGENGHDELKNEEGVIIEVRESIMNAEYEE